MFASMKRMWDWLSEPDTSRPVRRGRRLGLESLGERIVPANLLTWNGPAGGGVWSAAANWQGKVAPQAGDSLVFDNTSAAAAQDDMANLSIADLNIAGNYGGVITLAQNLTATGDVTIGSGKFMGAPKILTVPNATSTFSWTAGEIGANIVLGTFNQHPTLNILGGAATLSGSFDSFGNTTWQAAGDITMGAGAKFTNDIGATFDIRGDASIKVPNGFAQFVNETTASVTKSGGMGIAKFESTFISSGSVLAGSGTLAFNSIFQQNAGGSILLRGGNVATGGSGFSMQGGTLSGNGSFTGDIKATGGKIIPGDNGTPGTINVFGDYTQGAQSELVININRMGWIGLLNVQRNGLNGGTVSTGGILTVNRDPAYTPPVNTFLTFLTYVQDAGVNYASMNLGPNWDNGGTRSFALSTTGTADELLVR